MSDEGLVSQLRAYARQLDELPVAPRLERARHARWRAPRWSRREWIALAAAIAVLLAVAVGRIVEQSSGSGTTPSVSTGGTLSVKHAWSRDLGAQVDRAIDVPGGLTVVDVAPETTGDSTLVALERSSGKVVWRHRFPYRNGPWGLDGNTLVTGINGRTAGIDVRTGKQLWLVDVEAVSGEQAPPILVHDHVAYLVGGGDAAIMTALDVRTHHVLWRQMLGGTVLVTPVATEDSIVAAVSSLPLGTPEAWMMFLDPRTGSSRPSRVAVGSLVGLTDWSTAGVVVSTTNEFSNGSLGPPLGSAPCCYQVRAYPDRSASTPLDGRPSRPLVIGDALALATSAGTVTGYRADATSEWGGAVAWTANVGPSQQPDVTAAGGNAVVAGGSVAALSPADGSTVWTALVNDAYFPAPAAGDVVVAISRADGRLYVIDASDGHVVRTVRNGTAQTAVTLRAGTLVTASDQGRVTGYRITRR